VQDNTYGAPVLQFHSGSSRRLGRAYRVRHFNRITLADIDYGEDQNVFWAKFV
jgi:hypothetical protein